MTKIKSLQFLAMLIAAAFFSVLTSCTSDDLYDPDYLRSQIPPASDYFDFNTKKDVTLSINYGMPNYKALIEVYGENPLQLDSEKGAVIKKEGVEAIFKTFTDNNCKFEGTMTIPAHLSKVYIYTRQMGLPQCVELDITSNRVTFNNQTRAASAATRAYGFSGDIPYSTPVNPYWGGKDDSYYSICSWGGYGHITTPNYTSNVVDAEFTDLLARARYRLWKADSKPEGLNNRAEFMTAAGHMNLYINPEARDAQGNLITKAKLDVTFVHESAYNRNTFGYYYYKEGESFELANVCKFIVFPDVSSAGTPPYSGSNSSFFDWNTGASNPNITAPLNIGEKVRLKYFGEDGKGTPSDEFPAGYVVGWFILSNGYQANDEISYIYQGRHTSNDEFIQGGTSQVNYAFITLQDAKTGKVVIGVEDSNGNVDWSCEDMLFYVEADPKAAIDDPDRPIIPDDKPEENDPATETITGTLAYEDIWPSGGDYDMNDVIIEYKREVTFDQNNNVQKIVDTFKPVHKSDAATYENAFAYQIDAAQMGSVSLPTGAVVENETNSIILFPDARTVIGNTYVVTREFTEGNTFNKSNLKAYNPYIIVNYVAGKKDRTEVHLPKHNTTSMADSDLGLKEQNIWFIDKDGEYPYAIELPITNFTIVTETVHIDAETEYPDFAKWCESNGAEYTNWYLNYKGRK